MDLPDWYTKGEPHVPLTGQFYLDAFYELCTERRIGAAAVGPIPWSSIHMYANDAGLDRVMQKVFHRVIRELDAEYDKFYKKKRKSE